ncbi:hypothetical protein IJI00_00650 [Candidatus Saccharibacteria bacterium]|nr:hypothetical protein [Candidatus Saccharibacteria bacterium]
MVNAATANSVSKFTIECGAMNSKYTSDCVLVVETPKNVFLHDFTATIREGRAVSANQGAICNKFRSASGGETTPCAFPYWRAGGDSYVNNNDRVLAASNILPGGRIELGSFSAKIDPYSDGVSGEYEISLYYWTDEYGVMSGSLSASYYVENTLKITPNNQFDGPVEYVDDATLPKDESTSKTADAPNGGQTGNAVRTATTTTQPTTEPTSENENAETTADGTASHEEGAAEDRVSSEDDVITEGKEGVVISTAQAENELQDTMVPAIISTCMVIVMVVMAAMYLYKFTIKTRTKITKKKSARKKIQKNHKK